MPVLRRIVERRRKEHLQSSLAAVFCEEVGAYLGKKLSSIQWTNGESEKTFFKKILDGGEYVPTWAFKEDGRTAEHEAQMYDIRHEMLSGGRKCSVNAVFGEGRNRPLYVLIKPELFPNSSKIRGYLTQNYGAKVLFSKNMEMSAEQAYILHRPMIQQYGLETAPGRTVFIGLPVKILILQLPQLEEFLGNIGKFEKRLAAKIELSKEEKKIFELGSDLLGLYSTNLPWLFKRHFKGVLGDKNRATIRGGLVRPLIASYGFSTMEGPSVNFDPTGYFRWRVQQEMQKTGVESLYMHQLFSGIHTPDDTVQMVEDLSALLTAEDLKMIEAKLNSGLGGSNVQDNAGDRA